VTIVDYDVPVPMSDGTVLRADVFRPATAGRRPAILVRTPYNKLTAPAQLGSHGFDPLLAVREGYAVVIQDCRGMFASDGWFRHFRDEADDGAATIAWVASQGWSDGAVGMTGPSYMGIAQLLAATRRPPALKAVVPILAASEGYDGFIYQGGAFQLGFALLWTINMVYRDLVHRQAAAADLELVAGILADPWPALSALPLAGLGPLAELASRTPVLGNYAEWLRHPDRDAFWCETSVADRYGSIDVPALHVTGWYDIFLKGALENFLGLRDQAPQRLVVGPAGHGPPTDLVGELWFGPSALAVHAQSLALHLELFDAFLRGSPGVERSPVRIFVMGADRWRDEDDWPPARAVPTRFYLRSGGSLRREAPAEESPDEFAYDPRDPAPTVGGSTCLYRPTLVGPRDRRPVHGRADVLVFATEALSQDVEVTGPLSSHLYVATSARDTDFTVALLDIHPDGRALGIADGILRLRYRDGLELQRLATPGEIYELDVDLVATSNVFRAGHRIGVEISSSNFPRFDRNPNHGGTVADAGEADLVIARQRVFHDAGRASYVTLPVIPA
jgi:putative CocE/NonD family hydrolase